MATLTKELPPIDFESLSRIIPRPRPYVSHTNQRRSARPLSNEFQAPVATDLVSPDRACDWCGHTAERRLTVLGGNMHNKTGVFCSPCGQRFMEKVVNS